MSTDLNQCQFIGRLGKDVETRYTQSGLAVASFSIACGWKTKDKEGTEWVNITAFDKLAEICAQYLKKGSQVFIQGRMTTEKYEKDGSTRYNTKIIADKMQMLSAKSDGNTDSRADQGTNAQSSTASSNAGSSAQPAFDDDDDSIPF